MPRRLSEDTELAHWWAWRLPWAAAADIFRITGPKLKLNQVSNALRRGEGRGWLRSARIGRELKPVDRYVFDNAGIDEMIKRYGWEPCWWHEARGVRALARRLGVVELAYRHLPGFWQSKAISRPNAWVYANQLTDTGPGKPYQREMQLVALNRYDAPLLDFHWLEKGSIDAIATYDDGSMGNGRLRLPVL